MRAFFMKGTDLILTHDTNGIEGAETLKTLVEKSLDADKADDITIIPLDEQTALADYMIVASGTSSRHVVAMAQKLKDRIEGADRADWVVIDLGDIIVHLFRPEVRSFYNIEKMWGAPVPGAHLDVVGTQHSA